MAKVEMSMPDAAIKLRRTREQMLRLLYRGELKGRRAGNGRWYITADSVSQVLAADLADEMSSQPDTAPAA